MKIFLYIRGNPGTGKITVARQLQEKLGWRLFWFHDLKNAVFNIVQEHRIPRLMDAITIPVLQHLLEKGENVIYVRPSPDKETIENVRQTVQLYPNYRFYLVQLTATYETILSRVINRDDPSYRIATKETLDKYLNERSVTALDGEHLVITDGLTAADVAKKVEEVLSR